MSSGVLRTWMLGSAVALAAFSGSASAESLNVSTSQTNASCYGGGNGTATVENIRNGVAPFSYLWTPTGGTNATATGLMAGTYTVTVTDTKGLQGTASTIIGQPGILSGTPSQINPVGDSSNGSATIVPTGGTPGYTYNWTPLGSTTATVAGLAPGQYRLTITDSNACQTMQTFTLTASAPSVQSVSVPANGTYTAGQNLQFNVNYNAAVAVTTAGGLPSIPLVIGATNRQATFVGGSDTSILTFAYTVQPGDVDTNGVTLGSAIALNGSTMTSGGTSAVLTLANVGATAGVLVNGVQAQTITFANPGIQNFGTTPTLSATASSTLPVSFSSSTANVCTTSPGGRLAFVATGSCTIHANQGGDGSYEPAPQVSQTFMVSATAPGTPTIGHVTAGDGQAMVTFTAPASNGGNPITGYIVTATPVGASGVVTQQGTTSPIVVAGLTNGFIYNFAIAATNGTTGAPSPAVQATPRRLELVSAPGSVPGMAGTPTATMSGGGPTCTLQPGGGFGPAASTPPGLQALNGQFAFSAENCTAPVTMTLTYPSALPQGVQFRKPDGAGGWFDPVTALHVRVDGTRTTVTYTITDNGPGDTNPAAGVISDPLVPVLAAAGPGGGTAAIPTLSEWGVILMSALLAMFGLRRTRRQR